MTGLLATALTGFFVYATLPGTTTLVSVNKQEVPEEPTYETLQVAMTAYNAVEEQTDGDPHITAIGALSDPDIIAARSPDLAEKLPYGTVIEIVADTNPTDPRCGLSAVHDLIGYRVIADAMNARMRNKIDILFPTDKDVTVGGGRTVNAAVALGMCKDITIRIVGHVDISHMPKTQAQLVKAIGKDALAVR